MELSEAFMSALKTALFLFYVKPEDGSGSLMLSQKPCELFLLAGMITLYETHAMQKNRKRRRLACCLL